MAFLFQFGYYYIEAIFAKKTALRNRDKAHLALLATNIFFAINYSAIKFLINKGLIQAFALNLVRIGGAMLLLWVLAVLNKSKTRIHKKDVKRFVFCGLTGIALNQMLFVKGLSITYSIHASLLMMTTPILITVLAAIFLSERMTNEKVTGIILGSAGAFILITAKGNSGDGVDVLLGDILIILNAMSYTVYFILVKPLMTKYRSLTVIRMIFTIGFFMVLPVAWHEFDQILWSDFAAVDYGVLGFIVLAGTLLAYIFNLYGIKILGASVAGSYIYTQPVFATAVAMIVLHEKISFYHVAAAGMIFGGVYLANKRNRRA